MKRTSLSRSCKACVKAKRRCKPRFPRCNRCLSKGLHCVYDNEPLVHRVDGPELSTCANLMTFGAPPELERPGLRQKLMPHRPVFSPFLQAVASQRPAQELKSLQLSSTGLTVYEPTLPDVEWRSDLATVLCLAGHLKGFPASFARESSTPFIHPRLYEKWLPKQIQDVYTLCGSYSSAAANNKAMVFRIMKLKFDELIEGYPGVHSFEGILASVQAMILYLIMCLFDSDARQRTLAEPHLRTLGRWTRQLWEQVPSEMPDTLSPWQAWVFAESVRRSILISCLVQGVYSTTKLGYHLHSLFLEALPFDLRTLLWDAQSAVAWESLNLGPRACMISYREFVENSAKGQTNPPSLFEILLLIACNGKDSFEQSVTNGSFKAKVGSIG